MHIFQLVSQFTLLLFFYLELVAFSFVKPVPFPPALGLNHSEGHVAGLLVLQLLGRSANFAWLVLARFGAVGVGELDGCVDFVTVTIPLINQPTDIIM